MKTASRFRDLCGHAIITASFAIATPASADTLASLDRATFQTALSTSTALGVQNFDSLTSGTIATTLDGVTYTSSSGSPLITSSFLTSTGTNGLGRTGVGFFTAGDTATFSFTSAISAFGIDINTFAVVPGSYVGTLSTGDQAFSIFESFPGVGTGQFLGFVSDTPFTSLTLSTTSSSGFTLDTLVYGSKADVIGMVPEPATWAMMLVGFGMVGAGMRYRRRSSKVAFG